MDPAKNDKWWKSRIEKEQAAFYAEKLASSSSNGEPLSATDPSKQQRQQTARAPSSVTTSTKAWKQRNHNWELGDKSQQQAQPQGASKRQPAGVKAMASVVRQPVVDREERWEVDSQGPSPSNFSYPATPQFSEAGSKAGTEIMSRLSQLERDILEERRKREVAEREMKELLAAAKAANIRWPS